MGSPTKQLTIHDVCIKASHGQMAKAIDHIEMMLPFVTSEEVRKSMRAKLAVLNTMTAICEEIVE